MADNGQKKQENGAVFTPEDERKLLAPYMEALAVMMNAEDDNRQIFDALWADMEREEQKKKEKGKGGDEDESDQASEDSSPAYDNSDVEAANARVAEIMKKVDLDNEDDFLEQQYELGLRKRPDIISLDSAPSMRHKDENGFLHVATSNISKETVNPYFGREIPGWQERGIDPEHVFYGYRAGEELAKGAKTFDGLPLLIDHHIEDAENPQKEFRVGSLGTDARWEAPYLKNSLIVTDAEAIRAIEDGRMKELSCAYRYEPDWTPGTFEGVPYDFVMRNIKGNHVALVEEGRAGADVVVADAKPRETSTFQKMENAMKGFFRRFRGAQDNDPEVEKKEVELAQGIIDLHKRNPETGEIMDVTEDADKAEAVMAAVSKIASKLSPEEVEELTKAIQSLGMDEEEVEVVETEDDDLNTAEAVAYGEKKERDKLQSEHMKEDAEDEEPVYDEDALKAAADACGMDAEDPQFQQAFAEGVKYGERKEKEEPKHLDRLHESEGMKRAMDEEEVKAAMDAALHVASSKAESKIVAKFRALSKAAEDVRPVLGSIDPLAFDSASGIYGAALRKMGIDTAKHPRSAWQSMFSIAKAQSFSGGSIAQDSTIRRGFSGAFEGLNRIQH